MHHTGSTALAQQGVLHLAGIHHGDAQTGGAAVHVGNIGLTAQAAEDQSRHSIAALPGRAVRADTGLFLEVGTGVELGFFVVVFTARGLQVHLADHEGEGQIVQNKVEHADDGHPDPVGLVIALQDTEQGQVDQTAGEGHTHTHVQDVHEHVGQTGIDAVHGVHGGSHEEEGEFQGFGDAGEHGGQRGGQKQAGHHLALGGAGSAVHGQGCAGQTKDHQGELTGHKAGGFHREFGGGLGGQFCEEDVLGPLHGHTVDDGSAAHRGLPERNVKHMMQAEGNEGTLDQAIDPGSCITGTDDQIAQQRDAVLYHRPDIEHGNAHHQIHRRADDGDKAGAAEEGEHLGQLDAVEAVMQSRHAQAHDDAAEHAHLQGGDPQHGSGGVVGHSFHTAVGVDHGADGGVHDQVGNGAGQGSDFLFLLGHTDGHAHGKEQSQVVEHSTAALVHDVQNGVDHRAGMDDAGQAVGFQHGLVGERTADAQQQTCHREQSDGQHKRTPDTLQNAKDLIFHLGSSFMIQRR